MARVLRTGATLLVLDEITEGLAPVIGRKLGEVIIELKSRGFTIVMVEQNFRFAAPLADRHYVLEHGEIIATINADELPGKMDWLVEKGTELGMTSFVPLHTDRTVAKSVKTGRLRKIVESAAKQTLRGRIPTVHDPQSLEHAAAAMTSASVFALPVPL